MENISKALDLLNVPEELGIFNGQIQSKTEYQIVETVTYDFTNVEVTTNPLTGKKTAKRVNKITKDYSVAPKTQKFGGYGLNFISANIQSFGANYIGVNAEGNHELFSPEFMGTISIGPMAGKTYQFNWNKVELIKNDTGSSFKVTQDGGRNVDPSGNPIPNELDFPITIQRINKTINGTISIKATGEFSVTNVRTYTSRPYAVSVTKGYLLTNMNIGEIDLAENLRTIFDCKDVSDNTHVESLAANIVITDNKYKGDIYINGIDSEQIPYTTLIASMGLKFPQVVQRWRLYNGGDVREGIYGSTWMKQMSASENNEITIIAGTEFSWNETTKVLTYDSSKPTHLWYQFECLPAQGKNEGWEYILDLQTGLEVTKK